MFQSSPKDLFRISRLASVCNLSHFSIGFSESPIGSAQVNVFAKSEKLGYTGTPG